MTKTISIDFTGGFHNHNSVVIRAAVEDKGTYLGAYISAGQVRKLAREFCGMKSCICGGVWRADMAAPAGWQATTEGLQTGGLIAYRDKA